MPTTRSYDFYRALEDWEYGVIDDEEFKGKAQELGVPYPEFIRVLHWLKEEAPDPVFC
jgi:hypothetical protein